MRRNLSRIPRLGSLLLALLLAACSDVAGPGPDDGDLAQLRVAANVSGTPINTLVVEVTAPDITTPLVFNLTVQNGVASGTIKVPPGNARTITVRAFDSTGQVTHTGSQTINVQPGNNNPPVSIVLTSQAGHVDVTVSFGASSIIVSPAADTLAPGDSLQLNAYRINPLGDTLPGDVAWATDNPARATVSATGMVVALDTGTVRIYATSDGFSGFAEVTITTAVTPPPPADSGFTWTGAVSTDWFTAGNWSGGVVPSGTDSVTVPAGRPNYPVLTANAAAGAVVVDSAATVNVATFDLTVQNLVKATGAITGTTGRVIVTGNGAAVEGTLPRFRVTGGVNLTGDTRVFGDIVIAGGSLNNPGRLLRGSS